MEEMKMECACGRGATKVVVLDGESIDVCEKCLRRVRKCLNNTPKLMGGFCYVTSKYTLIDGLLCSKKTGDRVVGVRHNKYFKVEINGHKVSVSRIVWMLSNHREAPKGLVIDHKDGDVDNNHESNLRLASTRQNCQNKPRHRAGALCGAYMCNNRWQSEINIMGSRVYLGGFSSEENAHKTYIAACDSVDLYDGNNKKFSLLVRKKAGVDLKPNRNIRKVGESYRVEFMVEGKKYVVGRRYNLGEARLARDIAERELIEGMDRFLQLLQGLK